MHSLSFANQTILIHSVSNVRAYMSLFLQCLMLHIYTPVLLRSIDFGVLLLLFFLSPFLSVAPGLGALAD